MTLLLLCRCKPGMSQSNPVHTDTLKGHIMSSLMTNASAMTALQTLRNTSANLAETQNRISTGYRVAGAEDNAAYWSIATTMRSDNMALSAVEDSSGSGCCDRRRHVHCYGQHC